MEKEVGCVYIAATSDTKAEAQYYIRDLISSIGLKTVTVDLSTMSPVLTSLVEWSADIGADEVAAYHFQGADAVFCGDRGQAINAMAVAFERFILSRHDIAGLIGLGGSGGTALITPAMQALPIGLPKLMVSTMASGDIAGYIGASDISMMYSVTDIAGLNRISRQVLGNAAHQIAGAVKFRIRENHNDKPAIGLTMFGVTTPCVQAISHALRNEFDCLVFHATGSGGRTMEKLVESRLLSGVLDLTTTEVCDLLFEGVLACSPERFDVIAQTKVPYVASCGALDMVNFKVPASIPAKYADRLFYNHNAQVTLMRTSVAENIAMAHWIGEKLNRCEGEVRFLIPEGGFSALDAPGRAFWYPDAREAFIQTLECVVKKTEKRQIIRLPFHINDLLFAHAAIDTFRSLFRV
ncbi:Tm-1-like ATP-binding domain-containing protein [Pectobacterium sp. B1J-3]|uniref:Tm-1-like ATP-binding domain-containing protein n=1 Tax=Pectobacterium sp. B1J-3 TaxID=3385371 RepID=UPI003905A91A